MLQFGLFGCVELQLARGSIAIVTYVPVTIAITDDEFNLGKGV